MSIYTRTRNRSRSNPDIMPGGSSNQVDSSSTLSLEERVSGLAQRQVSLELAMEQAQTALGGVMDTLERMSLRQDEIMARLDAMSGHVDVKQERSLSCQC